MRKYIYRTVIWENPEEPVAVVLNGNEKVVKTVILPEEGIFFIICRLVEGASP